MVVAKERRCPRVNEVFPCSGVTVQEPVEGRAREKVVRHEELVRRLGAREVQCGIDQRLKAGLLRVSPRLARHDGGEVAPCAVSGHGDPRRIRAPALGLGRREAKSGERVLHRYGELVLGREAIVHRDDHRRQREGEGAQFSVVGVEGAHDEAASVKIDNQRQRPRDAHRAIATDTNDPILHGHGEVVDGERASRAGPQHAPAALHRAPCPRGPERGKLAVPQLLGEVHQHLRLEIQLEALGGAPGRAHQAAQQGARQAEDTDGEGALELGERVHGSLFYQLRGARRR
jgi:hypothetical protein